MPFFSNIVVMVPVVTVLRMSSADMDDSFRLPRRLILIPIRRPGPIDDPVPAPGEFVNFPHLHVGKCEIEERKILFQPRKPIGARNHDDALLYQIAQRYLRRRLTVSLPN